MQPAIIFDDVTITHPGANKPVLANIKLHIQPGTLALVVGRTGAGKSTLLQAINGLVPHQRGGTISGTVSVHGRATTQHRPRDFADLVGYVGQDALAGFVTDTVEAELAYGMEQLGLDTATMRKRVEETLDLLGIADLRSAPLRTLSGGQQQRVAIGSVLTTHPQVLVLDEPTSALDPTGAEEVLAAITRLVHDLAITVVIAEHRLERVLHFADQLIEVVAGQVRSGDPAELMTTASVAPPVVELGRWAGWAPLPLSVRDAWRAAAPLRHQIGQGLEPPRSAQTSAGAGSNGSPPRPLLEATNIQVRYGSVLAVKDVSLELVAGQLTVLMGRNGCGKSSLLWALQGSGARTAGKLQLFALNGADPAKLTARERRQAVGLVPQTPGDLLYLPTVGEECAQADAEAGSAAGSCQQLLEELAPGINPQLHPADLSEGQRLALVLAIQLSARPQVVLLDEPTRGLDYDGKAVLAQALSQLTAAGHGVMVSTHDVEFAAIVADQVLVMAAGELVAAGPASKLLTSSPAFAPQISKIVGHGCLTMAQVIQHSGATGV